jgi:leader peptidase (prepilin peptidase)/N-methyltransferase
VPQGEGRPLFSETAVLLLSAVFGLILGSFLNVLIYRLPRHVSVVYGRSKCPDCHATIAWFDNVPLASYLLLRGRCRHCRAGISPVYPAVEVLTAAAAAFAVWRYGLTFRAAWIFGFIAVMLVITIIDWRHQIIPDELSIGGIVFGWIGAIVCLDVTLGDSIIGSLVGGGLLLAIAMAYKAIRKVDGMGGGDIKLMAMIGAFLGWKMVFPVLFFASLFGSIYGLVLMRKGGSSRTAVAFGSFLGPSATLVILIGARLWQLYLGR